ncbi:MAG: polysaccharide biosynthesis protein [Clostridium sp.]|uniref:lipopolysaccharide biosynthesis protein n=1 Tax=Faecalibacillus intestinalis TaxID=1982626 RepID=UPI000D7B53A4|nr:MAG: polysaccharide biosynthesis protein [Clostridium sp.]
MKKQYKNLVTNSIVFTIANFGSKVITFLMVPLYTYLLTPKDYGTIDLVTTISGLLLPIIFLCVSDAVLRYTMSNKFSNKDVLSISLKIYITGLALFGIVLFIISLFKDINSYKFYLFCIVATNGLLLIFNQFLRGIGKIKEFAINGTLYTLMFVLSNFILLVLLKVGKSGYFLSLIIANIICILYAVLISKAYKYITIRTSRDIFLVMITYSLPLIPNSLMWWVMDASDKFIITYFLGVNANGIYAISKKLPTIIDTFHSIFNQAWQISAIEEADSANSVEFTSNVYKIYTYLLFLIVSGLLVVSRIVVEYLLSSSYYESWKYIPFLLLSVSFSSLSGFLSANFIANEKTSIIFKTTLYGAVVNTILNFILIPFIGINGAAIATMASYYMVLIIRERLIRKNKGIEILFNRKFIFSLIGLQIIVYYIFPINVAFFANLILFGILIYSFRDIIIVFLKKY